MSEDACTPPIAGMKTRPYNLPMAAEMWAGLLGFAIAEPECRAAFKRDTGMDLDRLARRGALDAMIDKATGYEGRVIAAFADWVTVNMWGVEGQVFQGEEEP